MRVALFNEPGSTPTLQEVEHSPLQCLSRPARWGACPARHGRALFTPSTIGRLSRPALCRVFHAQHGRVLFTPSTVECFSHPAR